MKDDQKLDNLKNKGFIGYLAAQALDAFNDNAYKIAVCLTVLALVRPDEGRALLISAASAVYILPFILMSSLAGTLVDRFSKRAIFVWAKAAEILVMGLGAIGFLTANLPVLFAGLFFMGVQSAILSPAKYGLIPELVETPLLAKANGLVEATTFFAIVCGTAFGGIILPVAGAARVGWIFVCVSTLATFCARMIPQMRSASGDRKISINAFGEVFRTLRRVVQKPALAAPLAGLMYFWFFGALLQITLLLFAKQEMGLGETGNGILLTALALGIGLGSLLAGRWSDKKIEIGLIPLGALGMAAFCVDLSFATANAIRAGADLFLLGLSGGLFIVPLDATVQHESDPTERGRVLAASNFLVFSGILFSSGVYTILDSAMGLNPAWIVRCAGAVTAAVALCLVWRLGAPLVRFIAWLVTHTIFDMKIRGAEKIPHHGPAILAANHVSYIDMILVGASMQRMIRFLTLQEYYDNRWFRPFCRLMRAIPIRPGDGVDALADAAEELRRGKVVCIFPEGQISRTGQILAFRRGIEKLAKESGAPIVPVHIDGMRGGPFTPDASGDLRLFPARLPWPVTVTFGDPVDSETRAENVRQAVVRLGAESMGTRPDVRASLPARFVETACRHWNRPAIADSTGKDLTYGELLTAAVLLKDILARRVTTPCVGLLLPTSAGAAIANLAASLAGKIPVNLNFTASPESVAFAARQCGIARVVTSRKFIEKTGIEVPGEALYLEDLAGFISKAKKIRAYAALRAMPARMVIRWYHLDRIRPDDPATIIFSSGSTGTPKGITLTHANILSNVAALSELFEENSEECFLGVLPFFHSFGWTGTMWYPLLRGARAVYHPNPMDTRTIGKLARQYKATFMVATPTFCRAYLRQIPAEAFSSLNYILVGAERLRPELGRELEETYKVAVLEGYGATECSPVVAVNVPDVRAPGTRQRGKKSGAVGRAIPGVAVKIVDPQTRQELGIGQEGLLLVSGPNVMRGYWNDPLRTATAIQDGWYVTGDMAKLDLEGFITLTGRISRFAKIGGEMVPLGQIEDACLDLIGTTDPVLAVTSVSDETRGERIIVVHTADIQPASLIRGMKDKGYPNLWIPKPADFARVDALPFLGTGKLDLMALRRLAEEQVLADIAN